MIDVVLVDDHQLVRSGIRRILDEAEGIQVIAEAASGEEALKLVREHHPTVVLMDVNMPGIGGLEATRKLLRIDENLKIIALTVHVDEPYPSRLLEAGAAGYLTKGCDEQEIIGAIRAVARGERYIGADIARQMALSNLNGNSRNPFDKLSQREVQVMMMITQGVKVQEISDTLCLSPKTVSTYRYRLYEKLGVQNDVELTHLAIRHDMIDQLR
ncbi:UvrY/SirA/GacA family response regulator transcription factor [Alkalilimnicola sp. S0819]|uniref:UvrY/SirA/GacA family response regulator transcription factor n=1 Tax=Alkalilimnicola sp. S0819 TaxID=2613922 RepID=UPI001261ADB3|nr:UvrY/SirA/GacA family response regulator transcription factor [Alkalilimnicola sp. S0819]KAB7627694.1 UvrY/SirA/GacA family response regulator transcription factor [Alkalilimnicola sp. S0819]MPQ15730.1 UvrY/SirA/GacA family response regulator transcription factor [Alkalilimnicola sp. S0819]